MFGKTRNDSEKVLMQGGSTPEKKDFAYISRSKKGQCRNNIGREIENRKIIGSMFLEKSSKKYS